MMIGKILLECQRGTNMNKDQKDIDEIISQGYDTDLHK
jgi:hypothetical protein